MSRPLATHCAYCGRKMKQRSQILAVEPRTDRNNGRTYHVRVFKGWRPAQQRYNPFCTLLCALAFACSSYDAGMRAKRP